MKLLSTITLSLVVFACSAACRADITGTTLADDHDGVLTCNTYGFETIGPQEFQLNIDGVHNVWDKGDILGDIITNTETDPKLTLLHDIDNDTGLQWTDYHATVTMSKAFTFDNVTVENTDWTSVVIQPTQVGSNWIGYIDYYAGDVVAPLGTLSFGYRMTFVGSSSFHEELMPSPEPGTLALLSCGLVGLFFVRRKFAR
jgi:hypothetical protein